MDRSKNDKRKIQSIKNIIKLIKINKIAGVDEVGRGCLAGPVFAAAVILNKNINTKKIRDSKKINFKERILLSH